jgi:hypothetical protein
VPRLVGGKRPQLPSSSRSAVVVRVAASVRLMSAMDLAVTVSALAVPSVAVASMVTCTWMVFDAPAATGPAEDGVATIQPAVPPLISMEKLSGVALEFVSWSR